MRRVRAAPHSGLRQQAALPRFDGHGASLRYHVRFKLPAAGLAMASIGDRCATGMVSFEIYVQEGRVSEGIRPALESALESVCGDVLVSGSAPVAFAWTVIAKGYGFRGGIPSTTSLVRGRIPDGCVRDTRERLLRSIGAEWCRLTGCAQDEVIVSARDWSWEG